MSVGHNSSDRYDSRRGRQTCQSTDNKNSVNSSSVSASPRIDEGFFVPFSQKIEEISRQKAGVYLELHQSGLTYEQIGSYAGVTRQAVQQLLHKYFPNYQYAPRKKTAGTEHEENSAGKSSSGEKGKNADESTAGK